MVTTAHKHDLPTFLLYINPLQEYSRRLKRHDNKFDKTSLHAEY